MPKLLHVNVVANTGSTGRLAEYLINSAADAGWETYFAYGRAITQTRATPIRIGDKFDNYKNALLARVFDNEGFNAKSATKKFTEEIKRISPDIIHLHNLHGYYVNLEILFDCLRETKIPVVWTLHDCWTFTGHCAYFDDVDCRKWLTACSECPKFRDYPQSFFRDNSKSNFERKREIFAAAKNVTFVTPSHWLENFARQSFLENHSIKTIHNGVDLAQFKPMDDAAAVRKKYGIEKEKILLGVASPWSGRKGFADFIKLSENLPGNVGIVLVGVSPQQRDLLPKNIAGIMRTDSVKELAAIYSLADVFLNPTYQDNFPTVNLEALACGTPVVTYDTGGSPESVNAQVGAIVAKGNVLALRDAAVEFASKEKSAIAQTCRKHAEAFFSTEVYCKDYMELYRSMI